MICFYYEDYILKETKKFFLVSELFNDLGTVRIEKSMVEKIALDGEDVEMLAILLAKLELIRLNSAMFDGKAPKSFLKKEKFQKKLKSILSTTSIENLLDEIHDMKYHELKEFFF